MKEIKKYHYPELNAQMSDYVKACMQAKYILADRGMKCPDCGKVYRNYVNAVTGTRLWPDAGRHVGKGEKNYTYDELFSYLFNRLDFVLCTIARCEDERLKSDLFKMVHALSAPKE